MNLLTRQKRWRLVLALALFLALLPTTLWAVDAATNYVMTRSTIDAGGGTSTGGAYAVSGTMGQSDANSVALTGGVYSLQGGYWHPTEQQPTEGSIFLPLVNRREP